MNKTIKEFLLKIIEIIFPNICPNCKKVIYDRYVFCPDCWKEITFINRPFCDKCSDPLEYQISDTDLCPNCLKNNHSYTKVRSAFVYKGIISKLIVNFKNYDKQHLAKFFAKYMFNASQDIINNFDYIIPVAMHKKKLRLRKYNQTILLAREFNKYANKTILLDFVLKIKSTAAQVGLTQEKRKTNLHRSFGINPKYLPEIDKYKGKSFAIIDDVMTTGSTIDEISKVLLSIGAKEVYGITVAKTHID